MNTRNQKAHISLARQTGLSLLSAAMFLALPMSPPRAQSIEWIEPTGNPSDFATGSHWQGGIAPNAGNDVSFTQSGFQSPVINSPEAAANLYHGNGTLNLDINNGSLDTGLIQLSSNQNNSSNLSVSGYHSPFGVNEAASLRLEELVIGNTNPGYLVTPEVNISVSDGGFMGFTSSSKFMNLHAAGGNKLALDVWGSNATTGARSTLDLGTDNHVNLGSTSPNAGSEAEITIANGAQLIGNNFSSLNIGTTVDQSPSYGSLRVTNESTATLTFLTLGKDEHSQGTFQLSNSDATLNLLSLAASTGSVGIATVEGTHTMQGVDSNSLLTLTDLQTGTYDGTTYTTGSSFLGASNGGAIQINGSFREEDLGAAYGENFQLSASGVDAGTGIASYIDFGFNNTYNLTGVGTGQAEFNVEDGASIYGTNTTLNIGDNLGVDTGSATMNVRNGSTVGIDNVNLGTQTGSSGTLNIENAGMTVQNLGLTTGGALSSANVNISGSYDAGGYQEATTLTVNSLNTGGYDQYNFFSAGSTDIQVFDGGALNIAGSFQDNNLRADYNESFNLSVDGIGQTSGYNSNLNLGDHNTFNLGGVGTGTAAINVTNNASLDGSQNAVLNLGPQFSDGSTGNGTLNVDTGGTAHISGLTLGQAGQGNLNINGGGSVQADFLQLTNAGNTQANVTLSGDTLDMYGLPSASKLTIGTLNVGGTDQFGTFSTGSTNIQVLAGAELGFSGSFQDTDLRADYNESFNMTVDGVGQAGGYSSWANLGENNSYNLGGIGTGTATLNVTNGGYLDGSFGAALNVGTTFSDGQTGDGTVNVGNFGSMQMSLMSLGRSGSGTLNVTDGGSASVSGLQLTGGANTHANINVSGGIVDNNLTPISATLNIDSLTLGDTDQFGTFSTGSTDIQVSDGGQLNFNFSYQNVDFRADWGESFNMTATGFNNNIGVGSYVNLGENNTINLGGIGTGTATLNVNDGAYVSDNAISSTLNVGVQFTDGQSGNGTVNVDGGNLVLEAINVGAGNNSTGNLNVSNGGQVQAESQLTLGIGQNANSNTVVDGSGSNLTASNLSVSKFDQFGGSASGDHDLTVRNGGSMTIANDVDLHSATGNSSTLTITGASSQATFGTGIGNKVNVSGLGDSTLNVADGAQVQLNGSLLVGNEAGTSGSVNITGANSRIYGTDVVLGAMGIGNLNVGTGATLDVNSLTVASGGTLSGTGTVDANLFVDGQLNPGNSPGQLDIIGDVTLNGSATTIIELGGLTQGTEYDFLNITGNVILGGILQFVFVDNFLPSLGDAFTFLSATGTLTGAFDSIVIDPVAGINFNVSQDAFGAMILSADSNAPVPLPGVLALMLAGLLLLGRRKAIRG